ncbi:MAG: recombinase family protein [Mucilaginibacter sp.]|uniref:recombinase family protein n=1 Tax=Mucilaginibacter sp. TaxID=1882438 RepID=UPI002637C77D|nr:recombinase family protein [Mucilaginibacter sp.]MDB5003886.1 recombinase family protein [Mucilaginibacter sp.]
MRIKYNRVSTIGQTGNRFNNDTGKYDLTLLDKVSGNISFRERPQGSKLMQLIEEGKVTEVIVEEFSRLGRNTGDVINTLDWLDTQGINVTVRNVGLQSRPNGIKNPIWKMISSVMSSLYEMELDNIKERTAVGRMVYVQQGGRLGRPQGAHESEKEFLEKNTSKIILKYLQKNLTIREIAKVVGVSSTTVMKVKHTFPF